VYKIKKIYINKSALYRQNDDKRKEERKEKKNKGKESRFLNKIIS
jgi:hypothetical protein